MGGCGNFERVVKKIKVTVNKGLQAINTPDLRMVSHLDFRSVARGIANFRYG